MKKSRLLDTFFASVLFLINSGVNAGLLGGSVSGCLGAGENCITKEPLTGWFIGPPKTIVFLDLFPTLLGKIYSHFSIPTVLNILAVMRPFSAETFDGTP